MNENDKQNKINKIIYMPRMFNEKNSDTFKQKMPLLQLISYWIKPEHEMVEIGSFSGGSTEMFALHCKKVYAVDCWADNDNPIQEGRTIKEALKTLKKAEVIFDEKMKKYPNVQKIRKLSMEAVNDFKDNTIDVIYIDGNHGYDSVCNDITEWYPKIKEGGIIAGHDYYENIKLAVNNTIGYPHRIYDDTSWLFIKGQNEKLSEILVKKVKSEEYGLFALVFQAIGIMITGKKVVIDYRKAKCYYDNKITNTDNVWEYYFEQPYNITIDSLKDKTYKEDEFINNNFISPLTNEWIDNKKRIKMIIDNRLKIKKNVIDKMEKFYQDNMKSYKILGIQKRGTDLYNIGHGSIDKQKYSTNEAIEEVKTEEKKYDKILIVTDSIKTLTAFKKEFGNKIIHYDDALLSTNERAIHRGEYPENGYKIGEDVLIEGLLLSRVNYLLAMKSNISLFAILKGSLEYRFIDKHLEYK